MTTARDDDQELRELARALAHDLLRGAGLGDAAVDELAAKALDELARHQPDDRKAYLRTIVRARFVDLLRRADRERVGAAGRRVLLPPSVDPGEEAARQEQRAELREAFERLWRARPEQAELLAAYHIRGEDAEMLAKSYGIKVNALYQRVARALAGLREQLGLVREERR